MTAGAAGQSIAIYVTIYLTCIYHAASKIKKEKNFICLKYNTIAKINTDRQRTRMHSKTASFDQPNIEGRE